MNLNSDTWQLLEKRITTSSITKTKRGNNFNYKYQDPKESNQEQTERLSGVREDDIHSVSSYYKEDFKPTPVPRIPQPLARDYR